jgi:hypothetical protein
MPEIQEIEVQVNDNMISGKSPGSCMSITTAADTFGPVSVVLCVSKNTGNRHLISRYEEHLDVIKADDIEREVVVSDEEILLDGACISHRKVTECKSQQNLCFHDFQDAEECVNELFGLSLS